MSDNLIDGHIRSETGLECGEATVGLAGDHHGPRPRLVVHCPQQSSDAIGIGQLCLALVQISRVDRHDAQARKMPSQPANPVASPDLTIEEDKRARWVRLAVTHHDPALARVPEPGTDARANLALSRRTHLRCRQILRWPHHPRIGPNEERGGSASSIHDSQGIRFIRTRIPKETNPLPHVRTHPGVEAPRTHNDPLIAEDRIRRKRAHERPSIRPPRPYRHTKIVEVFARPISDRVEDDVAVRAGLGSPLEGHAYGVDSINDEPRPDDGEPISVTIDPV